MIVWFVGLSGAGKSTTGRALREKMHAENQATVLIDGDEIREIFRHDQTADAYTVEGRRANAQRIVELCAWLDRQGINAVCSILCIFPDILSANRTRFSKYFEVFVDAPLDQVEERDVKGLYAAARSGQTRNVVGVDIPFPVPATPDMVIDNSTPNYDADAAASLIIQTMGAVGE